MAKKFDVSSLFTDVLKFGARNLVGVDIGYSGIKVSEVVEVSKGRYKLQRYGFAPLPDGCIIEDEIQRYDDVLEALKLALDSAGIKNKNACLGIYGRNTIAKRLQLASGTNEDIEDQVMWEAEQYIPFGVDDSTIDFHIIGNNAGGGTDVLVAAARNDLVSNFSLLLEDVGMKLKVADLQSFALCNLFTYVYEDRVNASDDTFLYADFGAQKTTLFIIRRGSLIFTRELDLGGAAITEEIQKSMGLSYMEAEDLKIHGDEKGNLPQEIVDIISSMLNQFFSEIKKGVNFFMQASSIETIEHCFIGGGTALLPGLLEGLEGLMGVKVHIFNPFERLEFNARNVDQQFLQQVALTGCVSLGLAMRTLPK